MKIIKVTSKGQITIPRRVREKLGITEDTYLEVTDGNDEIRIRKVQPSRPLGDEDGIWALIGAGDSRRTDIASHHDQHLAEGEIERWKKSS